MAGLFFKSRDTGPHGGDASSKGDECTLARRRFATEVTQLPMHRVLREDFAKAR